VPLVACFDDELSQYDTDLAGRVLQKEVPSFDGHFLLVFPGPTEPLVCAARRDKRSVLAGDELKLRIESPAETASGHYAPRFHSEAVCVAKAS